MNIELQLGRIVGPSACSNSLLTFGDRQEGPVLMSKKGSLLWVACLFVASPYLTTAEPLPGDTDRNPGRDHFPAKKPIEKEQESVQQRGYPPTRKERHLDGTI